MGEANKGLGKLTFNRSVKLLGRDERLTSDAGTLLLREADHRLGLTESLAGKLRDPRDPTKIRYTFLELLRERLYALAQGYDAQDDLDQLAHDPALKIAVWDRPGEQVLDERLASQPTQSRLIDMLTRPVGNPAVLRQALTDWCERHLRACGGDHAARRITADIDSFTIETHGRQQGTRYNGHDRITCYHPLVASYTVAGDYDSFQRGHRLGQGFIHAILRSGNVHTASGAKRFFREVIRKSRLLGYVVDLRIDAGFTSGEILDMLRDEGVHFLGRLKSNARLDALAAPYLGRPIGRPPKEGYEFVVELGLYQADSWRHPQRVILVVVDQPDAKTGQLNLQPDYFFLVTDRWVDELPGAAALEHYRGRGTFEDRLGEFRAAVGPHLSSPTFAENETLLLLSLLSTNLVNVLRCEAEDAGGGCWDLGRFQRRVLKAGGRVAKHSHRLQITLAAAVMPIWQRLLHCFERWRLPTRFAMPRGPRPRRYISLLRHAFLSEVVRE
jgi:Transposase DDE domain group 1